MFQTFSHFKHFKDLYKTKIIIISGCNESFTVYYDVVWHKWIHSIHLCDMTKLHNCYFLRNFMEKSLWNLVQSCYCLPLKVNIRNWYHGSKVSNRYFVNKPWEYTAVWNFFCQSSLRKRADFSPRCWKRQFGNA